MFPDDMLPGEAVRQLMYAYRFSHAIHAAAALGIADLLADGPKRVAELAQATSTHAPSLYRLLRALASVGVFVETEPENFALTPRAEILRSDRNGSLRDLVLVMAGGSEIERASAALLHTVRTGEPAFDHVFRLPFFDYLAQNPEAGERFNAGEGSASRAAADAILSAYDFSGVAHLVDVGGGRGGLLVAILTAYPQMRGTLFDQPHVVVEALPHLHTGGVTERCEVVGGDFFAAVPDGADAYLLRYIVHDWDDARAAEILRNCRRAMPPHGRLLLVDFVIPPGNGLDWGKWLDLTILTLLSGRERTAAEFAALCRAAGLELTRIIPTAAQLSIIEARPSGS